MIGLALLILAIAWLFPGLMAGAAEMMRQKPLASFAIGALSFFVLPVIVALLAVSVVGLPLAVMLGVLFLAVAPLAFAAAVGSSRISPAAG